MIPSYVWTILELYLTGVIHVLTAVCNPFALFGSNIPSCDPLQLSILLGSYCLRNAYESAALSINKLHFSFGVEFSLPTYTFTIAFPYFSVCATLANSCALFWRKVAQSIAKNEKPKSEKSPSQGGGGMMTHLSKLLGFLPTIRLRIDRFDGEIISHDLAFTIKGLEIEVNPQSGVAAKIKVGDMQLHDTANHSLVVALSVLIVKAQLGGENSFDVSLNSANMNINGLCESSVVECLYLAAAAQSYSPESHRTIFATRWQTLDQQLREIEQIKIDRQVKWRGDNVDDDLFFYDAATVVSELSAVPNVMVRVGLVVLEASSGNRSEEDISIESIKFESTSSIQRSPESSVQSIRSTIEVRHIFNGAEIHPHVDELLTVESQVTKTINHTTSSPLQVTSSHNISVGDLTLGISAAFLRGIVTLLDEVKFLGGRRGAASIPARPAAALIEHDSQSDLSTGSINILIKSDEMNGPNNLQQNVLVRLGHISKYATAHRSSIVLESLQVYLGNYDVDIQSVDGMMLYGNAIIALKTLTISLPNATDGAHYHPRSTDVTFADWIQTVYDKKGANLITEMTIKSIAVNVSQADIVSLAFLSKSVCKYGTGNALNVYSSLRVHAYRVEPSCKRTTVVTIGDIVVNVATENPLQRYRVLRSKQLILKLASIGTWWSSTSFLLSDDVEVMYTDGSRGGSDRLLAKIWAVTKEDGRKEALAFAQTSSFAELFSPSHSATGVGFRMSTTSVRIPKISVVIDVEDIKPLLVIKAACQMCYPDAESRIISPREALYQPQVLFVTKTPSSIFLFENKQLKVDMYHTADRLRLPAVELTTSSLDIAQVDFAGCSSQLSIGITNLRLSEMSHPKVPHKVIIDSVEQGTFTNKFSMHITSVKGENGIFEMQVEHVRVMYLQRATMTLVTFFRDHFFGAMGEVSAHIPQKPLATLIAPAKGMYRVCIVVRRSEFHMPSSSAGSDSLVVFFRRLLFYRTTDEYEKKLPAYIRGPYQSRKLLLSELPQVRKLIQNLAERKRSATADLHVTWKLPVYLHELMFTADEPPVSEGYLKLQLYEGSITSWCNSNLICTAMDAMATIKINPSIPNAEEPYETFDGDAYLMPAYTMRNTIIVEVFADEIDWVMAQGQYWLIVNSIQQNFMEWNYHIIDPFILPIFKKVELGERIFGKDPFNRTLPIASSVPVHIRKGSIIAAENDQDFLKNFLAFLPVLETFDDSFHHNFDKEIKTTVPSESPFHRFRDPLFSRWTRSETKREKLREYHHGLETPFALKFENLFLDFYRFHFGGGNGIEASATTLIAQQQARSEYVNEGVRAQTSSSFDDTDIRDLVLAPRHLSVFHSKEPHRSTYSNVDAPSAAATAAAAATTAAATDDSTKEAAEAAVRHIRYSQQGVANVRRCCVYVNDTVVTVNVTTMLAIVDFFVIPIQLTSQRNLQLVEQLNRGPFDYRGGLDVEVHMDRSYVCIPDPVNGINALCFDLKVDFAQSLRGFLNVGPGLALMDLDIDINNIFMAPLNEVNDIFLKPLVDPVKFRFLNEYTVLAPKETLAKHLDALNSWSTFSSWVTELPNRYDRASGQRIMRFFIEPLINPSDDLDDEGSTFLGRVEEPKSKVIRGQCSIKDLMFILSVVNGIRKSLKRRLQNLPKGDIYRNIILTIDDLKHQMSLDEQLVCVPWTYDLNVDVKEVHAQLSNFDFHVRNNTYNVNIGRLKLEDIIIIYARGPDHMHMATEVRLDAWTFNDDMDDWEPFIEPIQLRAIGATDSSRGIDEANDPDSTEDATPSIRIDVITDGLEVNLQQQALTSLIRKVRLGDVLTTSSNRLPPYMIINELGVNCKFTIGIQSTIVLASEIQATASYPVEVSRLADSLNTFKRQRAYQTYGDDNGGLSDMDVREYFIWISFPNFSHSYESKAALCIDKVGVHPFEMQMLKGGGKRDSQAFRKSVDTTVDSQGNPEPMRYAQELPYAILDMRIKEDGVRELHLRGWLSFKNTTSRLMQISLRLYGSCFDSSLAPGKEWHAPVRYANPKAQLFIRFDHKSDWIEALPYLGMIIAGGSWGCPTKLRARLCKCYREHDDPETTEDLKWLLLVRPEAKSTKSIGLGASNTSATKASSILVKYPNRDNNTKTKFGVGQMTDEGPDSFQIDDTQLASVISGTVTGFSASFLSADQSQIRPVCINLQAPLQFCSFLPQPLLYRLIDQEGTYCASGILLPGQTIDIHNITQIFQRRLMISVRMLNYAWSEYVVVFGRSNPFTNAEKSSELVLQSLLFQSPHSGKEFLLPQLSLTMVIKEFFVRFTCQVVLSNYTGQELLFAESSNPELYVPLGSVASVRDYLDANVPAKRKSLHSRALVRRSYVHYTADNYVDSDDEEGSHESASDDGQHSAHRSSEIASSLAPPMPPSASLSGRLSPMPMGSGGMFAEPGTNSRFKQIMNLKIHLPQDHQKVIEVVASSSWTLEDLFMDIKHRIDNHGLDLFASDFKFFPWIIDEKTVTAKNIQAIEDGEDDVKAAAQVRPISQNINIGNEMPLSMRFDLVMVLSQEPWNMRTPLAALNTFEMLLCHDAEVSIYRQVASIRGESISKEGIKAFFGKTRYVYKAQIARVTGEIPFKPYRMLGNPLLSISVPTETDWSAGVDVIKGEFDMGEMVITLANKRVTDTPYNPMYEFGVHLERGTGFMQQSTVATVVPKHILVSRLSYPIDIRQMDFDYAPSIVFLEPNSSCNFHYPNRTRPRQLQVKRSPIVTFHRDDADDSPPQSQRKQQQQQEPPRPSEEDLLAMETWVGEIDINKLGIVFVRLRHPLAIIKVETEVVGGSLVSTFSEQSLIWPPYRIDNKSNASVRFREEFASMSNTAAAAAAAADLLSNLLPEQARVMMEESMSMREGTLASASARDMTRTMSVTGATQPPASSSSSSSSPVRPAASVAAVSSTAALNATMQWDEIEAKGSFPYTWDHPFSGNRTIRLEVSAAGQTATKLVKLDDDIKDLTVTLKKKVPNLGNPLAEGYLTRCEPNNDKEVYCILRPDILYVYEKDEQDPSKHELLDVINLSKIKKSGKYILGSIARMAPEKGGKDFLSNTFTDFFSNISSTVNFIRQKTKMKFDLNYLRTLMLTLGDHLGYFTTYALDKVTTTRRRAYSDEHDIGLPLSQANRSANVSTESLDSLSRELSSHSGSLPGLAVEDNSDQASTSNGGVAGGGSGGSSNKNLRLKELLSAGASSQDLMDELQKHVVYTHQVIDAILASNDKYTPESAKELCAWLILHEYLIPYNPEECIRSFSFDGSMSARPSVFDASFLTGDVTGGGVAPPTVNTNGGAPIMPGMAMPTDTRPTLSGPSASTSSAATSSTRPTATLLGMARASKAMQYYNTLLNDCENMEMVFVPPPLNPEMLELQMSLLDDRGGRATVANTAANAGASSRGGPEEVFGFTLTVNDKTFSFKCSSGDEFRGWMQSARLAIELGWVDYMTGRKPLTAPKISDYQITYHLKTRADGSTKVLEITEVGGGQDERGKKIVKRVTSTLVDAFSFLPVFRRDKRALQASNLEELKESIDADRALISVYFNVRSVSLSIIDAAPSEVMYVRLQDVVMNVIRYLRAVQFTVTVRQLQFVDQLLNPSFPVTLFTRKLSPDEAKKIVLPGFEDGEVFGYPSLHLHLQQRYFKSAKNKAGAAGGGGGGGGGNANGAAGGGGGGGGGKAAEPTVSPANTSESKLWYFDVFTIWLAPMHLGVDEEIFVRLFRFIQSVRTTLVELEAGGKTRKVHEDAVGSSSADYRLLSTDLDRHALHANYMQLVESGRSPYALFATETKRALNMYFGLLQLYPLEVSISFRPSPDVKLTNAEYAIVSIIAQLDNAKIKLNSLFAENAFGSTVIIKEIVAKHYRAAFWKQFRNLIGATDIVEGSVGLVANLGTGVYDLFNESVEGLNPNEKKSFLHGLSRGGMSLASHTIGGTSGFTSRIAGGIGKGVSMLTLDTEFQRNRTYRKYNQANTLSEGLYVGTQELGRNIVEGVTGIVVSPYRGWEQGGGVGLATGMARGILGVALKPAVGVLDLASRATEGLRNTTMQAEIGISAEIEGVRRCRIPRAFGRSGMLQIYDVRAAAAQCMADYLADFRYDPRLQVVAHLYCRRKIETVRGMTRSSATAAAESHHNHSPHDLATTGATTAATGAVTHRLRPQSSTYAPTILVGEPVEDDVEGVPQEHHHEHGGHHPHAHGHHRPSSFGRAKTMSSGGFGGSSYGRRYEESAARDFTLNPPREAWGLPECTEYVILVTPDRVALVEVNSTVSTAAAPVGGATATVGASSGPAPSIADVDFDGDNDAMSVSSRATTASTIAPSVVSTTGGLPPTGSSGGGGGGGMFGAFRSKTKKLTSMGSSSSVTAGIAGSSGATTASGASSALPPSGASPSSGGNGGGGGSGGPAPISVVTSLPSSANKRCRFIWVCPANCIDELSSDNRGDMQLKLNTSLLLSGAWHQRLPTILDATLRNFTIFQSLLEQVIGVSLARQQPLHPPFRVASSGLPRIGGLLQQGIRKKYSTGIRSVLMSPSVHTYWVYGHVLYEYTAIRGSAAAANAAKHGIASSSGSAKQMVPTAAPASAAAPAVASGSELSDYFNIENTVDDQLSPEAASSSSRPASGFFANEAAMAAAAAGGPPALSTSSSVTYATGPNTFNSGATASPATNAAAVATNNAKSPLDDLMEKTIAAIAVTPTKSDRLDGDYDDGSVRPRQRRRRSSGSKHRRQKRSDTADGASSMPPPRESPEKDSDDDDEAYNRHRQQQRELQQTQQQLFPTETAPLTRERRSSSAGSLSDMSAVSQASLSSVSTSSGPVVQPPELQDQYLSFVYPLVDITMHGPTPEEGGKFYSISIQRMDNAKMRCLRRDDPNEALSEYMKSGLSLLFPTKELAMNWRLAIESRITLRPTDCLPPGLLTTEDKKREYGRFLPLSSRNNVAANGEKQTLESVMTPVDNSVLGVMILPTSGCAEKETETIKIEIFKTLSAVRR